MYPTVQGVQREWDVDKFVVDSRWGETKVKEWIGGPFGFPLMVKVEKDAEVRFVKGVRDMWMVA